MAALDLSKSAFASARRIVVQTPASKATTWRSHVVDRIATLSKVALIGTTLSFAAAHAHDHGPSSTHSAEAAGAGKSSSAQAAAATGRQIELMALYRDMLANKSVADPWAAARAGLVVHKVLEGVDLDDARPLFEKEGVDATNVGTVESAGLIQATEALVKGVQLDSDVPAAALVLPHAFYKPAARAPGNSCTVHVNVHILPVHDQIKAATGLADDVVRDFIVRHEFSHCLEIGDRNDFMVKRLVGSASPEDPLLTDKTKDIYANVGSLPAVNDSHAADAQFRKGVLKALSWGADPVIKLQGEEYSDALSALVLLMEGRIEAADVVRIAEFRKASWDGDQIHDTSSLLMNVVEQLQKQPEVLNTLREGHQRDVAAGKGLQIGALTTWLLPLWKAHAQARDDQHQLNTAPSVTAIPGYRPEPIGMRLESSMAFRSMMGKKREQTASVRPR